jgi:uncharacterized protein (DUF885 family)
MTLRPPSPVDVIAEHFSADLAEFNPVEATFAGLPGHDHQLGDYSPDGLTQLAALHRQTLQDLAAVSPIDEIDVVTMAAMRDRLGIAVELYEADSWHADLNVIASPVQTLREVFDVMPTTSTDDWANIASRLRLIPQSLAGYRASLSAAARRGRISARRQVEECIAQALDLADPQSSFFTGLAAQGADTEGVGEGLSRDLAIAASQASAAYNELADFLSGELLASAPEEDAVGPAAYQLASRNFVGADLDLEEAYTWGLSELARLTQERQLVIEQLAGDDATIDDAIEALARDPRQNLDGVDALQQWMQETSDAALDALDGTHFDIPAPLRTLECRIAPTDSGAIYYTGPSEDFSRPGRMWWAVPAGVTTFSPWREKTTVYHEGVPGHHLQIGQSVHNADQLNTWRRLLSWSSGHGEGWALYAETLMTEFGFMDAPADRLGYLDSQLLRAARVVVDIGVHLRLRAPREWGGDIWNANSAWRLLRATVTMDDASLRFELNRYLGWPGQAPSYLLGQRLWQQARADAHAHDGSEFSLKTWHNRALRLGSVPLGILGTALRGTVYP